MVTPCFFNFLFLLFVLFSSKQNMFPCKCHCSHNTSTRLHPSCSSNDQLLDCTSRNSWEKSSILSLVTTFLKTSSFVRIESTLSAIYSLIPSFKSVITYNSIISSNAFAILLIDNLSHFSHYELVLHHFYTHFNHEYKRNFLIQIANRPILY